MRKTVPYRITIILCVSAVLCVSCTSGGDGGNDGIDAAFANKEWGIAELLETYDGRDAYRPQVGVDGNGNAIAVWSQSDGIRVSIWASRYVSGTGWGTAERIELSDSGNAFNPQVDVDGNGNAIAVWEQWDGTRYNIWANRYVAGHGWLLPQLLETNNSGDAGEPQVGVDGDGNAVAVWHQSDGTRYNIWANRYIAGKGWGSAELIETDESGGAFKPQVGVDGDGNAIAVWSQSDGTRYNIWANRYVSGTGWGTAVLIEVSDSGDAYGPQVGVAENGNAIAVWYQFDGTRSDIWATRYIPGIGWFLPQLIETDDGGSARDPQVGVDANGNAIAVWTQFKGSGLLEDIWANRYTAGKGWGSAERIEKNDNSTADNPQVGVDGGGNAVAVWSQYDVSQFSIWANRYVAGTGWGSAELIEMDESSGAFYPQIGIDGNGNAVAVWQQAYNLWSSIWANTRR